MKASLWIFLVFVTAANSRLADEVFDHIHYFVEFADVHKYFQLPSIVHNICPDTVQLIDTLKTIVEANNTVIDSNEASNNTVIDSNEASNNTVIDSNEVSNNTAIDSKSLRNVFDGAVERLMEGLKKHGADLGKKYNIIEHFHFPHDILGLNQMAEKAQKIFDKFSQLRQPLKQLEDHSSLNNKIEVLCAKLRVADVVIFEGDFNVTSFLHKLIDNHFKTFKKPYWTTYVLYLSLIRCMMVDLLETSSNICELLASNQLENKLRMKRNSGGDNPTKTEIDEWKTNMGFKQKNDTACKSVWGTLENLESPSGTIEAIAKTEKHCKEICESEPECLAIDFDGKKHKCTTHFNIEELKRQAASISDLGTNSEQYIKNSIPECEIQYELKFSKKFEGGILHPEVSTLQQCKELCEYLTCTALNHGSDKCFIMKEELPDQLDLLEERDWIILIPDAMCPICETQFKPVFGKKYKRKGSLQDGVASVSHCKRRCLKNNDCSSFDFDFIENSCLFHGTKNGKLVDALSATHYEVLSRTSRCSKYLRTTKNAFSSDAKLNSNVKSSEACNNECLGDKNCVGMYFCHKKCNIHDAQSNVNFIKTGLGCHQLETKYNCIECGPSFTKRSNQASPNGILQKGITSLAKCRDQCRRQMKCLALDFNKKTKRCTFHYRPDDLKNAVKARTITNITRHYLISRCPDNVAFAGCWKPSKNWVDTFLMIIYTFLLFQ